MALEAVVFPQDFYPFRSELVCPDLPAVVDSDFIPCLFDPYPYPQWKLHSSSCSTLALQLNEVSSMDNGEVRQAVARPIRRRSKSRKNKVDIENQRMTHIAVERNRRKQMNEHLTALRSFMPGSYCQRVDQASIIGSAINFVKELEYKIQLLDARKRLPVSKPSDESSDEHRDKDNNHEQHSFFRDRKSSAVVAEIEASMVESHANLKIRTRRRPKQLLRLITGLQALRLTVLHLNVHTVDQIVHYSLNLKVEECCELKTTDEISSSVYQIFLNLHEQHTIECKTHHLIMKY